MSLPMISDCAALSQAIPSVCSIRSMASAFATAWATLLSVTALTPP